MSDSTIIFLGYTAVGILIVAILASCVKAVLDFKKSKKKSKGA